MSGTHHDDEWKLVGQGPKDPPPTRAQLQERLDFDYGSGKVDRDMWSKRFDELSKMKMIPDGTKDNTNKSS